MPSVDLLCLANSYKNDGRCVAGLDLDGGGWVRPVSDQGEGELSSKHYSIPEGGSVRVLDHVRCFLAEQVPKPHQPENWLIEDRRWELVDRPASPEHLDLLEESVYNEPELLRNTEDSVPDEEFQADPASESLAVIRPEVVHFLCNRPWGTRKARAIFRFEGVNYDLSVTDPDLRGRITRKGIGEYDPADMGFSEGRDMFLTISLAEPFKGDCYKVVAAAFALPEGWL